MRWSVCLSAREHISRTKHPIFTSYSAHVTCGCGSVPSGGVATGLYVTHAADLMDLCWCGRPDYCYRPSDSQVRSPSSLMNRFRADQGPCRANLHRWGLAQSPSCDCGQRQTMNHIVDDTCPLTKFEGELNLLHEADDHGVARLESTASAALAI